MFLVFEKTDESLKTQGEKIASVSHYERTSAYAGFRGSKNSFNQQLRALELIRQQIEHFLM